MQARKLGGRDNRIAHIENLTAQALREKEAKAIKPTLELVKKWVPIIIGTLWVFVWFLLTSTLKLIRKYPRRFVLAITLVASAAIGYWRSIQGLGSNDKFFLLAGLLVLMVGVSTIRRHRAQAGKQATLMGSATILGGVFMLYLGFL